MLRFAVYRRRGPQNRAVGTRDERPVVEVAAEQPELPELVRDVLADVGDGSIGADDHFFAIFVVPLVFLLARSREPGARSLTRLVLVLDPHHPAARELSLVLKI